jgi:hypothetical protein
MNMNTEFKIYGTVTAGEISLVGCTKGTAPSGAVLLQTVTDHPEVHWVKWCLRFRRSLKDTKALEHPYASYFTNSSRLARLLGEETITKLAAVKNSEFLDFNLANPHVLPEMIAGALAEKAAGRSVYSAQEHVGRVRWGATETERGDDRFKINSVWSAWYARLIQMEEPNLIGFFRLRDSLADGLTWKGKSWAEFAAAHAEELRYSPFEDLPDLEWEYNDA